ncbi:MAG: S8 family serine peptidase [Candidatus Sericytochromatia bacterium]
MSFQTKLSLKLLALSCCLSSACQTIPLANSNIHPTSKSALFQSADLAREKETDLKLESLMPTHFGLKSEQNFQAGDQVPGRFIVKFKDLTEAQSEQERSLLGVNLVGYIQRSENIQLLECQDLSQAESVYGQLQANPHVEFVEPDSIVSMVQSAPPALYPINDPLLKFQYAHVKAQSQQGWALAKEGKGLGENTIIAIADTGVDGSHPDLKDKIIPGYSALAGKVENADTQGHGTHCAGIAAATTNNLIGIAGFAPKAKIMPIRILNDNGLGTLAGVSAGITYATNHAASVISMSFASPVRSAAIEKAMNYALSKNTVLVAAMGNSGNGTINYPAAYPGIIAVGATDASDQRAAFSEYGSHISVLAPGVNIVSTLPGNKYIGWNGTSMATPAVAGVAALVKSVLPNLTPSQVKYLIEKASDDMGAKGFDTYYGYGRINVYKTLNYAFIKAKQTP